MRACGVTARVGHLMRIALALPALAAPAAPAAPAVAAPAQARRFELDDLSRLVRLAEPQVSPDGRAIAFLAARPNYAANRWDAELVLLDVATGARRVLVAGRPGLRSPRWARSGDRIAFLATVDERPQVLVQEPAGGEARVATRAPRGVRQFAWRPDGGAIAYVATDTMPPPAERHNDAFEIGNDHYLTTAAPAPAHLWIVPTGAANEARRLTRGDWSAATSLATSSLSWAPDGRTIAYVRFATPHSGDTDQSAVWLVDAGTGAARALTGRTAREGGAAFSPDGAWIAYNYPRDGDPANLDEIHVAPASGGAARVVTRALDRHVTEFAWLPDGRSLLVVGTDGTRAAIWIQPLAGPARRIPLGDIAAVSDLAVGAGIAFVGSEPGRPAEIYYLESPSSTPRRLSDFHGEVAARALGRSEPVAWDTHDGMRADGVLTRPPAFSEGSRYPLVLLIHGGPTASSTEEFSARAQLLAARGWLVFQPNYRGSDNRGNAFQRAIAASAAEAPGRDIMAGVAALVRRGIVDTTRLAVTGWSYGGYLTAWLLGRYPDAWRAAVAGAAPMSLLDMYNLSDLNVMRRHAITASPWVGDRLATWLAESPLAHAWRIRAPTLILSNTGDARVAVTGSYALYRALRDNNVPVQFVAYPGQGHSPGDPVRQRDVHRRWIEWLEERFR
jgi:dipeptidyl aminopeptidase/acylaminoacyl peptidase